MDGDHVTVLDPQVVSNDTVQPSAAIVEIIIRQHNKYGILPLLAANQNCVASEKLEVVHRGGGKDNS